MPLNRNMPHRSSRKNENTQLFLKAWTISEEGEENNPL